MEIIERDLPWVSDSPFGNDIVRETLICLDGGRFRLLNSSSDNAEILATTRNHRPEMRFRLTYDGELTSSSDDARKQEKWNIRKHLQPQLAELWEVHPALQGYQMAYAGVPIISDKPIPSDLPSRVAENRARLREYRATVRGKPQPFLPLVRSGLLLTCALDILFMRKDAPGGVLDAGDIDNRITTLFDGLRMPNDQNEFGPEGELPDPFHTLLENDRLITALTIRTDRLLTRPGAGRHEVRLVIDVIVSPTRIKMESNSGFVAD
jgi:hypothetical protein